MIFNFLFLGLIFVLSHPQNIHAITPTATPSIQATSSAQNSENISDDIQKIRDAVKQKVQEKLKTITTNVGSTDPSINKKALIGTVIQINGNNLTIDHQNNTRNITVSSDTVFMNSKNIKTKLDSLKVGQDIIAMGYLNNNTLEAKRIVFTSLSEVENNNQIIIGKIVDISKSSPIMVLIPSNNKNNQYQIKTDSKTEALDRLFQKSNISKLTTGQRVITIVNPESKTSKTYLATKIINLDLPSASPSAKPTTAEKSE